MIPVPLGEIGMLSMLRLRICSLLAVVLFVPPFAAAEPPPSKPGIVFVVGGIGGIDVVGPAVRQALPKLGLEHEVRVFVWTHGKGQLLRDLQDAEHVRRKAEELAEEICEAHFAEPDRPIFLIGKSGGAGLSLLATEMLPRATLERLILLSAAVKPTYDLRPALRATRGELVSFYSPGDWLILGWGTLQFGTIDRVHSPSAGLCGFTRPAELSPEDRVLYQRLVQVPWSLAMIAEGYPGGHIGTSLAPFVGKEVAPWLKP
jgi:hypothetical protein